MINLGFFLKTFCESGPWLIIVALISSTSHLGLQYGRNQQRYETVDLRALRSWRGGQLNLAHGTETEENKEKLKPADEPTSRPCRFHPVPTLIRGMC